MKQEDYVDLETAKLLKSKGFDWHVNAIYAETKVLIKDRNTRYNLWIEPNKFFHLDSGNYKAAGKAIKCPSLAMAMKWLRKVHNICIIIFPEATDDDGEAGCLWGYSINKRLMLVQQSTSTYMSYNDACESAINDCLTILN